MIKRKTIYIIISSLIAILFLYIIEQHIKVSYFIKTATKIIIFILIPYCYVKFINKDNMIKQMRFKSDKNLKYGFILGMLSFLIVIISFVILKYQINFDDIINELETKSKITAGNFIFIGLYITFINSFLEEFFFRGFIFLNLYELGKTRLAYIFSSLLFALYHIAIFKTWFNIYLTIVALIGLIIIGLIFNYVDTKSKNLLNSWVIHILADSAIILIGLRLFGII